jgi:thiol-disulfide isomerase/thioredoxin
MKRLLTLSACLFLSLHAQVLDPPDVILPPKEAAMDALFAIPATLKELEAAEAEARKQGVPEQTIYEARFLFHVEHKNDQGIIALLPIWEKQEKVFSLDHSEIFATREDFLAVIEFSRALKALSENKRDDFKKHITEALWLSPAQASAFTPYIENLRLAEHIRSTQLDFSAELPDIESRKPSSLQSMVDQKRALLLHFWSPWSPDCDTAMMDLSSVCPSLEKEKIALASVLVDGRTEILAEAKDFLKNQEKPLPGPQLIDRTKNSLSSLLRVTDLPTLVLISPEGKILFHGKPGDEKLMEKIKQLPSLKEAP